MQAHRAQKLADIPAEKITAFVQQAREAGERPGERQSSPWLRPDARAGLPTRKPSRRASTRQRGTAGRESVLQRQGRAARRLGRRNSSPKNPALQDLLIVVAVLAKARRRISSPGKPRRISSPFGVSTNFVESPAGSARQALDEIRHGRAAPLATGIGWGNSPVRRSARRASPKARRGLPGACCGRSARAAGPRLYRRSRSEWVSSA